MISVYRERAFLILLTLVSVYIYWIGWEHIIHRRISHSADIFIWAYLLFLGIGLQAVAFRIFKDPIWKSSVWILVVSYLASYFALTIASIVSSLSYIWFSLAVGFVAPFLFLRSFIPFIIITSLVTLYRVVGSKNQFKRLDNEKPVGTS